MKRLVLIAGLLAAIVQPVAPAAAASGACYSQAAMEADQAIRFVTDVMVVSSACQDTIYGEFRMRNKDPIIAYQKALIAHFRGASRFDSWNTALANEASRKQGGMPTVQLCQQAAPLMNQAKSLDPKGFRAYAAAQAVSMSAQYTKCGK